MCVSVRNIMKKGKKKNRNSLLEGSVVKPWPRSVQPVETTASDVVNIDFALSMFTLRLGEETAKHFILIGANLTA